MKPVRPEPGVSPGRGRRTRPPAPARDQEETGFTAILSTLLSRVPAALGAALVDRDGETVDYAGLVAPFEARIAAAHWRIVADETRSQPSFAALRWLLVRATRRSYVATLLPQGYALVLVLESEAGINGWQRAVAACGLAMAAEAGWSWVGIAKPEWSPVLVVSDGRGRPLSVEPVPALQAEAGRPQGVEILGVLVPAGALARYERGWRVRLQTGIETTLVREPGGAWYADDPIDPVRERPPEPGRPRKTLTRRGA